MKLRSEGFTRGYEGLIQGCEGARWSHMGCERVRVSHPEVLGCPAQGFQGFRVFRVLGFRVYDI